MDFVKGGLDGKVNQVIDQAADVAKEKIGGVIGGQQTKGKKEAGGMGDMLSGAIGKAAADKAADQAADQALNFGKNLFK